MPEQTGRGRPRTPLGDVVFSAVVKAYEGKSGRRVTSALRVHFERGLTTKVVSYNTLSDYLSKPELTPLLRVLLQESAAPLKGVEHCFAIDSTGFGTRSYDRWYDEKWGRQKSRRRFVKVHAACGVKTHVCTDLIVSQAGDATQLEPLLDGTTQRFVAL